MCKVASRMLSFPFLNLVMLYEITILLKVDTKLTHFKRGHLYSALLLSAFSAHTPFIAAASKAEIEGAQSSS